MYTVGNIGRYKVVSTKLPKHPTSSSAARISAENTVTRLLGKWPTAVIPHVRAQTHRETHPRAVASARAQTQPLPMQVPAQLS